MKDVARQAGVSVSSVSRYINDPNSINPIPALNIEKAIRELGYIPNTYAQSLKRGGSRTIGVIVPGLGPFFSSVCTALSDFFFQHKYLLYICETGEDTEREQYYIRALVGHQVAGLLIAFSGHAEIQINELNRQFPNVVMFDQHAGQYNIDSVCEDNYNSSYELTKYMISRGHRRFVLLFRTQFSTNTPHRIEGTTKALKEAGLDINDMCVHFDIQTEQQLHERIWESQHLTPRPTAIIGYSPLITENAMIALNRLNIKVPDEIDLAGYTLREFNAKFNFEIPSVIQRPYELGIRAGDVLLRKLRRTGESAPPRHYRLQPEILLPNPSFRISPGADSAG